MINLIDLKIKVREIKNQKLEAPKMDWVSTVKSILLV